MSKPERSRTKPAAEKLSVNEAQDAIAATFGEIEQLAWRFFAIARDLQVDNLEDEDFPDRKPGPDHLRWFTALSGMAAYYDLLSLLESAREAAVRTHQDLVDDWAKKQEVAASGSRERAAGPEMTATFIR